jgi:alpha-beta hydrolase superfamily lysophospholipase
MSRVLGILAALVLAVVAILGGMIAFGTGAPPPPLASIANPFRGVDFSDLPPVQTTPARKGSPIAFRAWRPAGEPERVVIAVHGSSATGTSLHPLGKALRAEGFAVYAPDIRGHGATGRRGDIDYAGQLDDDLADLVAVVRGRHPAARLVLLGLSSGGGFALHAAATPTGRELERTILLAPMLGPRAPTVPGSVYTWARPFIARIVALTILDRLGIRAFEHLPAVAFAIQAENAGMLTSAYSYRLMRAFGTRDYAADLRGAPAPIAVLVGENDQLFPAKLFAPTVQAVRADVPVTVVPGLAHVEISTDARAMTAIVAAIRARP